MIGCETGSGITYITKIEDFENMIPPGIYNAMIEFVNRNYAKYEDEVESLKSEIEEIQDESDDLDRNNDDLRDTINKTEKKLDEIIKSELTRDKIIEELKVIYKYL
jgi:predicted  nucleic acid-binding Zn-ribbon protein